MGRSKQEKKKEDYHPRAELPPDTYCQFGKRNLPRMEFLYPLLNNKVGDLLNLEARHEQLFFIKGDQVLDNIGYSEESRRFNESEFGNDIKSLEDLKRHGYWLFGKKFEPKVILEALERLKDGEYYSIFSNQCQDWADRLRRKAHQIEREKGIPEPASDEETEPAQKPGPACKVNLPPKPVPPSQIASIWMGLITLLLGLIALLKPTYSIIGFGWLIGIFFVVSGFSHLAFVWHMKDWRNMIAIFIFGLLYLGSGLLLLLYQQFALVWASFALAGVLAVQGAAHFIVALLSRPFRRWAGTLLAGLTMLLTAFVLLSRWPDDSEVFLGKLIGLCLVAGGLSTILLSRRTREALP